MNIRNNLIAAAAVVLIASTCLGAPNTSDESNKSPERVQSGAFALSLGTPAGINLTFTSAIGPRYGLYVSGMYLSRPADSRGAHELGGVQIGVTLPGYMGTNHFRGWLVSVGTMHMIDRFDEDNFTFAAFGHIWKYKALYTQVDMMVGYGDFSALQLGLQVGVVLKTLRRTPSH